MSGMDPKALPLAHKVLEHITSKPQLFDMSDWTQQGECGTTACLAGWAVLLSGNYPLDKNGSVILPPDFDDDDYELKGAELLGISYDEAGELFYMDNDDALERLTELITEAESKLPPRGTPPA